MALAVVILAAGRGVRMTSERPKVLHEAAGRTLLDRVLLTAGALATSEANVRVVVVVGSGREEVVAHLAGAAPPGERITVAHVTQEPQLGTGDAVRCALASLGDADEVLVLSGDVPLLRKETLEALLGARRSAGAAVAFLTAELADPAGYGRVVRGASGELRKVVERKDATEEERAIREINGGVYAFERAFLESALPSLSKENAQGEYYLTDVLALAVSSGRPAVPVRVADPAEVLGVNSRRELSAIDTLLRTRAAEAALDGGATLLRPETITLDDTVTLEPDVVVEPFTTLLGRTRVAKATRIGQGCVIKNSEIGRGVTIKPYSVIEGSSVGDGAIVGPFARLREGTELAENVHVGNFVETKKARLARGVKANHLTYLGDTSIGEGTNVGAGVITCNYDGFGKHHTEIGRDVFVGSDVQLVAPVTVGDGAIIGAGTTVTSDVPPDALAVSRTPQRNLQGAASAYRERKRRAKAAPVAPASSGDR
jgi:bifunctional UDP-N-acetylglucosamine pyrophosphorylase / glucosamine-1-phosphate N-acetyltransferase